MGASHAPTSSFTKNKANYHFTVDIPGEVANVLTSDDRDIQGSLMGRTLCPSFLLHQNRTTEAEGRATLIDQGACSCHAADINAGRKSRWRRTFFQQDACAEASFPIRVQCR